MAGEHVFERREILRPHYHLGEFLPILIGGGFLCPNFNDSIAADEPETRVLAGAGIVGAGEHRHDSLAVKIAVFVVNGRDLKGAVPTRGGVGDGDLAVMRFQVVFVTTHVFVPFSVCPSLHY